MIVSNHGPEDAESVLITDALPVQLGCSIYSLDMGCSWQPWMGSLALGTLEAGRSITLLVAGIVDPCIQGAITNRASVSSLTFDPDLTNNTATVTVNRN